MVASMLVSAYAQDTQALRRVWAHLNWESCPHHYNFHLHTHCSDGQMTPIALIDQAVDLKLKGLAITDHHSVRGYQIAQNYLQNLDQAVPQLWTGIEITSDLADVEVHILGYGFNPDHPALVPYLQGTSPKGRSALAKNVIYALHHAGGLAVLAHPERYYQAASHLIPVAAELGIDGVEAYYAYGNPKPWQPSAKETETVLSLAADYGLLTTGGTDSHGNSILQRI